MDTALFSAGNLFTGDDSDDSSDESVGDGAFVERDHEFPGMLSWRHGLKPDVEDSGIRFSPSEC